MDQAARTRIRERQQRWEALAGPGRQPGFVSLVRCPDPSAPKAPPVWRELAAERREWAWGNWQRALARSAWLDDDSIPCLHVDTGTEIFAEAFGCEVHRPADNKPFALPLIHEASQVAGLKVPELSSSSLAYLFDLMDDLRRRAGPDAPVHLIDTQSPMDTAALIWEKSSFMMALIETPEAVLELAAKVRQLFTAFLDEWFRRYGPGFVAHYPDYWMPRGITLSEDEIGAVDAETCRTLFMPELAELSRRYGGIGIHCCADAGHQWENLAAVPGLQVLNFNKPPVRDGNAYIGGAYRRFADLALQYHIGWQPDGGPADRVEALTGTRHVLEVHVDTPDNARATCLHLRALQSRPA